MSAFSAITSTVSAASRQFYVTATAGFKTGASLPTVSKSYAVLALTAAEAGITIGIINAARHPSIALQSPEDCVIATGLAAAVAGGIYWLCKSSASRPSTPSAPICGAGSAPQ